MLRYHLTVKDRVNDTVRACELIMPDVLDRERAAAKTKWYGYRFMSPLAATKHFADLYRQILKRNVRANQGIDTANKVQGLRSDLFDAPSRVLTEVWNARLLADEMGIPYDLLIEFGLEFASRRKWNKPPRLGQVFGTESSADAWAVKLEKFLEGRFEQHLRELHDLPQYRNENYRGFHAQDDLRAYLISELRNTSKPWHMIVQSYCMEHRYLPLITRMRVVPKVFRSNVISNLKTERDLGRVQSASNERLPLVSYVPGCFGMPVQNAPLD